MDLPFQATSDATIDPSALPPPQTHTMRPRRPSSPRLLALLLPPLLLATSARAHAAWTSPRCRGTLSTSSLTLPDLGLRGIPRDDCPHCLNGGGKGGVMAAANKDWRPWEPLNRAVAFRHDAGLCGDPVAAPAPRAHEKGGPFGPPKAMPFSAVYKPGQTVGFQVDVTTNHNGFFEFFICDVAKCGGDIHASCFQKGFCRQLMRAKTAECEGGKSRHCGPVDPAYPGRWIVPCRVGGHVGEHFMGGKGATLGRYMQYKLPDGFTCENCVMQWYWASANSCNPPGFVEYFEKFPMKAWGRCPGDGGAFGARNPTLSKCGGATFPEEFWSCADVKVRGAGGGGDDGRMGADDDLGTRKGEREGKAVRGAPVGQMTETRAETPAEKRPAGGTRPSEAKKPADEARPVEKPKATVEKKPVPEQSQHERKQPRSHKPSKEHGHKSPTNTAEQKRRYPERRPQRQMHQQPPPQPRRPSKAHDDMRHNTASKRHSQYASQSHPEQPQSHPQGRQHPPHRRHPRSHEPHRHQSERRRLQRERRREHDERTRHQKEGRPRPRPHTPVSGSAAAGDCVKKRQLRKPGEEAARTASGGCAPVWTQCGGRFYKGPTSCCAARQDCFVVNEYFSQCRPAARS